MMKEETIRIQGLSIGYIHKKETKVIAKDMDATICSGELTCLLGANGAGKSTLLRTLSAFLKPLSGNIWIQGRGLSDYRDKELATVIGVVLTEKCQLRNMTVTELVGMGRSPYTGFWGTLSKNDRQIVAIRPSSTNLCSQYCSKVINLYPFFCKEMSKSLYLRNVKSIIELYIANIITIKSTR